MCEYTIDHRRILQRAYEGLAAGDLDVFVKPLAPGIVKPVLAKLLQPFTTEVLDLRIDATQFTLARGRVQVEGVYSALTRADGSRVTAPFRHEWDVMYGVAWRLRQLDEAIDGSDGDHLEPDATMTMLDGLIDGSLEGLATHHLFKADLLAIRGLPGA